MGVSVAPAIADEVLEEESNKDGEIPDSVKLKVVEVVGYILYGVYILGAVVVLINMLIAMMSNTFEDIQVSAHFGHSGEYSLQGLALTRNIF